MAHIRRFILALIVALFALTIVTPVDAQGTDITVTGSVIDAITSLPVPNARIQLTRGDSPVDSGTTATDGSFSFHVGTAGLYAIVVEVSGYQRQRSEDVAISSGERTTIRVSLNRAQTNDTQRTTIGRTTSATRANTQIASTVNRNLNAETVLREGILRAGDALQNLPGITGIGLDSSPGDDLFLSIRGTRSSEAQALIDGHPIGPLGVAAGPRGAWDYQLSPAFALRNIQVTYGTGGANIYGVDAIGGTIDMQTIDPTAKSALTLRQGIGTLGRMFTIASATGTNQRLGYAFVGGVEGTYGSFAPQSITQTGNLAGNLTSANVTANTFVVSQNFNNRQDMAKLRYQLSPSTSLQLTAYAATLFDDKTGNGGNGYSTPEFVAANATLKAVPTAACPSGLSIKTDATASTCVSVAQYAAVNSGPAEGSPVTNQELRNQDYSVRASTTAGPMTVVGELFRDSVGVIYNRNDAGFTFLYLTNGARISADIASKNNANTFGFGAFTAQQAFTVGSFSAAGSGQAAPVGNGTQTFFLRDTYAPTDRLTLYLNANLKREHPTDTTSFEPRLAATFRLTNSDVVRFASGRSSDQPQIGLVLGAPTFINTPGRLSIACGGLTTTGSGPNPSLASETAVDYEIGYGHRFARDTFVNFTAYDEEERNAVFSAIVPLVGQPYQPSATLFQQYLARIASVCNSNPTIANLGFTTSANAGYGRFRGIDLSGRVRLSSAFFIDYSYDLTSSRLFNIPLASLQSNVTTIDGGQVVGIPYQTGNLGFSYAPPVGFQFRIDGNFVGSNNGLGRPNYIYGNASIGYQRGRTLLNVGVQNVFNSDFSKYNYTGYGVFTPENQFGKDRSPLQQAVSGAGGSLGSLPERALVFSVSQRL